MERDHEPQAADRRTVILRDAAPLTCAAAFLEHFRAPDGRRALHHLAGTFYIWRRTHYGEVAEEEIRADLYDFLESAGLQGKKPDEIQPINPNKTKVANVLDALRALAQIPAAAAPPAWLDWPLGMLPACDLLACSNGLLHLPTRALYPHSAAFFGLNALDFPYDPETPAPARWLQFLDAAWASDPESIELLQELFGLLLTGDTSHQKAFLLIGPKRSGKGTIARVLTALLGQANVCGPTLSSLGQNFGLEPLIGKRAAIISDARLGGKTDQQVVIERLLAITGEDSLSVPRKFKGDWTGRLETRFLVLTNELPRLADASGAAASRFLILLMTESFYGREDAGLTRRLLGELPGILNWSLDGLDRLRRRGHFIQPAAGKEAQRDFEDLGSPIGAFIRDRCETGPTRRCRAGDLYDAWLAWSGEQHMMHPGTAQSFGRDVRAVVSGLKVVNPRNRAGVPERWYQGVGIRPPLMHTDAR